jgi:hypothetical protein
MMPFLLASRTFRRAKAERTPLGSTSMTRQLQTKLPMLSRSEQTIGEQNLLPNAKLMMYV